MLFACKLKWPIAAAVEMGHGNFKRLAGAALISEHGAVPLADVKDGLVLFHGP